MAVLSILSGLLGVGILGLTIYSEDLVVQYEIFPREFADTNRGVFSEAYAKATHPRLRDEYGFYLAPIVSISWYIAYEVIRISLVHLGTFFLLSGLRFMNRILQEPSSRSILARGVMNVCFLGSFGYHGICMWKDMIQTDRIPASIQELAQDLDSNNSNASNLLYIPPTPHDRLYQYIPNFQRLSAVMAAFQIKNIIDTIYYKDGFIFFIHHLIVVFVAAWALHPFAHFHGTFFFGVSETSTTLLALLANFSAKYGVPALEYEYPISRKFFGFLFALSFIIVRSILWPFFTYFFIKDCLAVLDAKTEHDTIVVTSFIVMLLTLSVMQVLWLFQIISTIYKELFASSPKEKAI
uniref:TLC domain-containing protein n=1 Tax=Aureoumbra lagunensis TaxID=44058 RepID=A0A7S3K6D2_9STRA|mmetsp:Transcript_7907/g.12017  ORF Transcript_7907/g.12017 Transcript_7907/m.12017 type:complete len:352 (+) Transcript_7907:45-1100(+)